MALLVVDPGCLTLCGDKRRARAPCGRRRHGQAMTLETSWDKIRSGYHVSMAPAWDGGILGHFSVPDFAAQRTGDRSERCHASGTVPEVVFLL